MIKSEYERRIKFILNKVKATENIGAREFIKVVNELREQVILAIAEEGKLDSYIVELIKGKLKQIINIYKDRFEIVLSENQRKMFVKGIQVVDTAIETGNVIKSVPYLSEDILNKAREFGGDLITGLTDNLYNDINKILTLGVMGQKSQTEIVNEIAGKLPSPSIFGTFKKRSLVIFRTEINRIFSLAGNERTKQFGSITDKLFKYWKHSHLGEPRLNHLSMEAKPPIPYNENYKLIGQNGMVYEIECPYDPILPASETINCRCMSIPIMEEFV